MKNGSDKLMEERRWRMKLRKKCLFVESEVSFPLVGCDSILNTVTLFCSSYVLNL
jgi:hypothetical protein